MCELSVAEISRLVDGDVVGDADRRVVGIAPLETAGPDQLSFVASGRYLPYLLSTSAGAVLFPRSLVEQLPEGITGVQVRDPHASLAELLPLFYPERVVPATIHSTAQIGERVRIGREVSIGAYSVLGDDVRLGDGCRVAAHVVVGAGSEVGDRTVLHAHVTVYPGVRLGARCIIQSGARLGADGFGYVFVDDGHRRVPQVGGCVIGDDVDVGANTTIDRGSIGDTVVGRGTKIDNLVQIGHNVRIGEHAIVVSQVGISGSTTVETGAVLGGQAGVGGHLRIGAGARVGAQAGVTADVAPGETVSGYPARPHREALRAQASLFRLPRFLERLRALERAVLGSDG